MSNAFDSDSYFTYWAEKWLDVKQYSPVGRHTRRMRMQLLARCPAPDTFADFGSGEGSLLSMVHAKYPAARLFGCDFASESVRRCRQRLPQAEIVFKDLTDPEPPFAGRVSVGVCSEVLEHIEDDARALHNLGTWAEHVIITVPGGELDESSRAVGHLRHYTKDSLRGLARRAGLEVLHLEEWGFPFSYPWYARVRNKAGYGMMVGRYSMRKKMLCHALYLLFFGNDLFSSGNKLFMLCHGSKA
jgi:hypothetical protein